MKNLENNCIYVYINMRIFKYTYNDAAGVLPTQILSIETEFLWSILCVISKFQLIEMN